VSRSKYLCQLYTFQEIMWLLPESLNILKFESEDQPEGQLFSLGFKQLEEFKPFLEKVIPNLKAEAPKNACVHSVHMKKELD